MVDRPFEPRTGPSTQAENVFGDAGKACPGIQKVDFAASAAGDGKVAKPSSEPYGRGRGGEIDARIDGAVDVADKFPEFSAVDLPTVSRRIQNRHAMVASVSNADQKRRGQVDSEDIESHPLGDRAVREGAGHREAGHPGQHQVEIHRVGVVGDLVFSPEAQFDEQDLVQMGEQAIHAASIFRVFPARKVRHPASNPLRE